MEQGGVDPQRAEGTPTATALATASDEQLLRWHIGRPAGEGVCRGTAFRELVQRHHRKLWWAVRRVDIHDSHHMDIFQEGLLRIHRHAHQFRGEGSSVSTWMTSIMYNCALTYVAKLRREASPQPVELEVTLREMPAKTIREENTVERLDVYANLKKLDPKVRQVVALNFLAGLSEEATANRLGIPVGTVKSRKNRGKKQMQALLVADGGGEYACRLAS
ncbi:RNA polymerase sigma factor [Corynebacterium auriscanis]|uniref:RNA polymerase sigma factor n=1 Tax=Corynebacterium auriscanis TaxID=99807 RepID=UPI0009FF56D0|nr:sigma-70 family RNA polymerase sigma factor [Corynebacterium auriscanis]WJY73860.1 ECF RNA polymerase sigma factor SigE [Corynebacterium auriscanis]